MKFNGVGIGSSVVFMILVSMVRQGQKSTFVSAKAAEDFSIAMTRAVKEANKRGVVPFKRSERR
jgi:hypothetical protein